MVSTDPTHIKRYEFASKYIEGKRVLDAGGADGFGAVILAEHAVKVVSVDNDPSLVARARKQYKKIKNLSFEVGDVRKLPFPDNTFDVAIALEVIEHFFAQEQFLKELQRVVKPGGTIIISTPDHTGMMKMGIYQPRNEGHGHPKELTLAELVYFMNRYFERPQFYGQVFYGEPSRKDNVLKLLKRADVLKLRKLLPQKSRDKHNLSARIYKEEDCEIRPLDRPALQLMTVATNRK